MRKKRDISAPRSDTSKKPKKKPFRKKNQPLISGNVRINYREMKPNKPEEKVIKMLDDLKLRGHVIDYWHNKFEFVLMNPVKVCDGIVLREICYIPDFIILWADHIETENLHDTRKKIPKEDIMSFDLTLYSLEHWQYILSMIFDTLESDERLEEMIHKKWSFIDLKPEYQGIRNNSFATFVLKQKLMYDVFNIYVQAVTYKMFKNFYEKQP